ncbi:hypothetical protein TNCV_3352021 [Trichonephila clavipes]|nr:hypothetical protein TNCV_3352021 [Trichonephila clavipes]
MKNDRDGRTYRNSDNCSDTELTPVHVFDCSTILVALRQIGVLFPSTNLYVDSIEQIAREQSSESMGLSDLVPSWTLHYHHHRCFRMSR